MMRATGGLVVAVLLAEGCGGRQSQTGVFTLETDPPRPGPSFDLALLQLGGATMVEGNRVALVNNGEVFDAITADVSRASSSIHVVIYIWRPGGPSERLTRAITERARQGVACRILVDPLGSPGFDAEVKPRLEAAGCEVDDFRPVNLTDGDDFARNHRKIVVLDGGVAYTGGFAIWEIWEGDGRHEDQRRETNVRVVGPVVRQIQQAFAENWTESTGKLLPDAAFPDLAAAGPSRAAFVRSTAMTGATPAEKVMQLLFRSARQRLWVANAYFMPSEEILDALAAQALAGVDVRLLLPGPRHDKAPVLAAQRATYGRLLDAGVRIFEYQPSMMHAKTILVDDRLTVVGSINLDHTSLRLLDEGSLVVDDPALAARFEPTYEADLQFAQEITLEDGEVAGLVEWMAGEAAEETIEHGADLVQ